MPLKTRTTHWRRAVIHHEKRWGGGEEGRLSGAGQEEEGSDELEDSVRTV